ncbi:zinc-binding alcohol dehydrogenase family protein [Hymenobacter sp. M29]|uniref:Zinc-binding alcohol dehydrogenase family protein n=1 Tax=Hymenobacter mellowenesis TaxID=3063995 RepID=A0ABT9AFH5_9BACT|nr:zinc-binding alcohol dehydrogenase family protein [Hymenobacter sp. M29]MDO7848609.1 zinc-binding alcohol dehydrogenase family protein [Hymenobacter sp. M29]
MKAAVLYSPGVPGQFRLEERPVPVPAAGQVLLRVRAFGLNRSELMTRKGLSPGVQFPRILGIECVGEVVQDPSGEYPPGQQVAALMGGLGRDFDGSYAEYAVMPKTILYPFRSQLPWAQLGAIPEMFQTVYGSLHLALKIQAGETLLIRGGTSSIGLLAAQLASQAGLTVLATTRNAAKADLLMANGATHVLVDDGKLREPVRALFPQGVDRALELVGATTLRDTLSCLKPGGLGCMTGMLSESWSIPDFAPMEFIPATVGLTIYDSGQVTAPAAALQEFIDSVEAGRIRLGIGATFPLDDIVAAHQLMDSNAAGGKIVVTT